MLSPLKHILTHEYKDGMIVFLNTHPAYVIEAIELAIKDEQPYSWRSAWLLWSCMDKYHLICQEHTDAIINSIPSKSDGHQRELLKILYVLNLNDDQEGLVYDMCVRLWEDIQKKPSIRYTAYRFLIKIAQKHPDLLNEIKYLTEKQYIETLSPGIKKGIYKLIQTVKKTTFKVKTKQ